MQTLKLDRLHRVVDHAETLIWAMCQSHLRQVNVPTLLGFTFELLEEAHQLLQELLPREDLR